MSNKYTFKNSSSFNHFYNEIYNLWHNCLDNPSKDTIGHINKNITYLIFINIPLPVILSSLLKKRNLFHKSFTSSSHCFDIIHMDLWGPFSTQFMSGHIYFLKLLLDVSYEIQILNFYFSSTFVQFLQAQFNKNIKTYWSDIDPEFILKYFYLKQGIHHQKSYVDTLQQTEIS